ncbi:MAG: sigma-54-dependent Fis family transcriptional regulator [Desulfuromonadaceae bacterium]|nr:sigma-54-dependent Fis family transcriptional regulator [Desulfuromonadaceae bacterium]MDD2855913.1 sigma-54-dependent Fis family transcriptional regulator [Desulfuromonadaceae bacterium]
MATVPRIMIVDDEEGIRFTLGTLLKKDGYIVETAADSSQALAYMAEQPFDLVFSDIKLINENGLDLLHDIKSAYPSTQVVMFTGRPELDSAIMAVREGAFDYMSKPIKYEHLISVARLALENKKIRDMEQRYSADLEAIFRSITDAIIMFDSSGKLQQFNDAAAELCGYCHNDFGSTPDKLDFGCGAACRETLVKSLREGVPHFVKRMQCRKKDGTRRIISLTATPVLKSDKSVNGIVAVLRDETRLVYLEQSLCKQGDYQGIVGQDRAMLRLYNLIETLADMPTTVLICGESGTGKELVASALHHGGSRHNGPFIKVNCSALSENLLENELFGHVRGAFTGALDDKKGRFERADGGTIFLDEIGDISSGMQMRLLRVLQEFVVERVGDATPIKVDVRIVTATNQNLEEKVKQGTFRQDLYYRLNVVKLQLPPLRDRPDDIPQLADHFLKLFCVRLGRSISGFDESVLEIFLNHTWPGNVRELEHVLEHACVLCTTDMITVADLPDELQYNELKALKQLSNTPQNIPLEQALEICKGNKSQAAKMLGISRRTIYRHLGEV